MKVLLTGAAGFVGHYVLDNILKKTDWDIVCLDRLDTSGDLNRISKVVKGKNKNRVKIVFHDLKAEINNSVAERIGNVDYILHLAASSHVDRSITDPMSFVMDNVVGTCNILNFARTQKDLKRFVYFSTDEVFGPANNEVGFGEYDRYNSSNPYAASKAGGEELAVAFHNTYKLPIIITHTMNVFGKRQHPEKFIPMCISKIINGDTVLIHSDENKQVSGSRHYIHADDVADALLFLIKTQPINKHLCAKYNIASPDETSNLEAAKTIAEILGKPLKYEMIDFHSSRPGHDLRYSLDTTVMKQLGWIPKYNFINGIKDVVDDYIKKIKPC